MEITKRVDSRKLSFSQWLTAIDIDPPAAETMRQWAELDGFLLADGQHMVEVLLDLHMDDDTLLAAFSLPTSVTMGMDSEKLSPTFGSQIVELHQAAMRMDAIKALQGGSKGKLGESQVDNIRRMLLAMVEDVRAVRLPLARNGRGP